MKFKGGKSHYDQAKAAWIYEPRVYTDFYCSLAEWSNLGNGKENFMYQVRNYVAAKRNDLWESADWQQLKNGLKLRKISLDRTGRRDDLSGEIYSAEIIKEVILAITHKEAKVEFYSWKGNIDHVEITFENCHMPNIIVLVGDNGGSTNYTLIKCIDCIYSTLSAKLTDYYDNYLNKMYNNDYDRVYYVGAKYNSVYTYDKWKYTWRWEDTFKKKTDRVYDRYNVSIDYK